MFYQWGLFLHYLLDYYWYEKITVLYIMKQLQLHFWITFLGKYNFFSNAFFRLAGMPRRIQTILMLLHFGT
jgi:heme/copper-type cytochrome/quinol oxidase subunit 1